MAYCDGKRIPTALGLTYELQGNCRKRNQDEINAEVAKFFNDSIHQPTAQTQSPSEVYFTVQVAAIKKEDNGVLKGVPELHYNLSPKGLFKYSSGKFDDLALANLRKNELKKAGYNDAFIVAYRDGIPVSFREAEVALNFLKEPRVLENPTVVQNQNLEGTTLPTPKSIYYTFTKPQSLLGCQDMMKYNYHIPFSVATDALHSGPILSQNLSPYLFIYYSDFEINKVDSSDSLKWVLSAPEDRLAMAHDFAVRSEIRYRVIKSENQSNRLVFYPESPTESSIVMNLAQQLNLEISKEGE